MAASRHCSSWADLRPELLGLVLWRLPSLADRVRLAAVCRSWRHSARLEPVPPPFPWLTRRDGTFFNVPDGKIHRLPSVPPSMCVGSVGNWLFLEEHSGDGGSLLSLMNPFSKDIIKLPDADTIWCHESVVGFRGPYMLVKLVLLSPMADLSPDSLFAVLITNCVHEYAFSICQPSTASAFCVLDHESICDVALVDGKLYALSTTSKLFVLEVESSGKCKPKISSMRCIENDFIRQTVANDEKHNSWCLSYLVESSGKLLHVRRLVGCLSVSPREDQTKFCRTFSFEVFEVDLTTSPVQWRRLNSLEGETLFVGRYSKALRSSKYGAQADCIYFMCDYGWINCLTDPFRDPFRDSGVFNMRNGTITSLSPETTIMQEGIVKVHSANKFYSANPSWFFPY